MQLLQELRDLSYLQPLKEYLDAVKEFGIDIDDDTVFLQVNKLVEDIESNLSENRSEFNAGREMAIGAGVNLNDTEKQNRIQAAGLNNPRLGLQDKNPQPGQRILLTGSGDIGQIVKVSGDSVMVKNKSGFTIEVPRRSLIPKTITNKQSGQTSIGWIEQTA